MCGVGGCGGGRAKRLSTRSTGRWAGTGECQRSPLFLLPPPIHPETPAHGMTPLTLRMAYSGSAPLVRPGLCPRVQSKSSQMKHHSHEQLAGSAGDDKSSAVLDARFLKHWHLLTDDSARGTSMCSLLEFIHLILTGPST